MSIEQADRTGALRKNPGRFRSRAAGPRSRRAIGDAPARFRIPEPQPGYREAAEKLAIWEECCRMWPWLRFSDRFAVEQICDLMYKLRHGVIKAGERSTLSRLQSACGGDPSGLARIKMQGAGDPGKPKAPASDPRNQYLASGAVQ